MRGVILRRGQSDRQQALVCEPKSTHRFRQKAKGCSAGETEVLASMRKGRGTVTSAEGGVCSPGAAQISRH